MGVGSGDGGLGWGRVITLGARSWGRDLPKTRCTKIFALLHVPLTLASGRRRNWDFGIASDANDLNRLIAPAVDALKAFREADHFVETPARTSRRCAIIPTCFSGCSARRAA